MTHTRRQLVEKLQVAVAAAAALLVAYFLAAPAVAPWDAEGALAFVPTGQGESLALFAVIIAAIAAGCAVLTISARFEGALLATLAGVAGVSLHGGPMRTLLWACLGPTDRVFQLLALEVLAMVGVLLAVLVTVYLVRGVVGRLLPQWKWHDPLEGGGSPTFAKSRTVVIGWPWSLFHAAYKRVQTHADSVNPAGPLPAAAGLVMELVIALVLLVLTFRSTDRGQINFALGASFLVAVLAAHQAFPARSSLPLLLAPLLMGAVILALGAGAVVPGAGPDWRQATQVAQGLPMRAALPVDWLAWGCGGAVAGLWFSRRIREARFLEAQAEKKS